MSLIVLKNIKKEYGKNQVLFNDLSLEIEQGEFVGLIGKSGAGNNTSKYNRTDYRYIGGNDNDWQLQKFVHEKQKCYAP